MPELPIVRGQRSHKLRINYRTTHEIRNWAVARLHGLEIDDLDEGTDSLKGERSLRSGDAPDIEMFADIDAETQPATRPPAPSTMRASASCSTSPPPAPAMSSSSPATDHARPS